MEDNKTLLLVEDEVLIAISKQKELERYGYNVQIVNTVLVILYLPVIRKRMKIK